MPYQAVLAHLPPASDRKRYLRRAIARGARALGRSVTGAARHAPPRAAGAPRGARASARGGELVPEHVSRALRARRSSHTSLALSAASGQHSRSPRLHVARAWHAGDVDGTSRLPTCSAASYLGSSLPISVLRALHALAWTMLWSRQPAALGCVCGIALSWVASTQLSQTLVSGEASGANLFLVWFSTNFNVMVVPLLWSAQPRHLSLCRATTWGGQALPIQKLFRAAMVLYPLWMGANYLYVRALALTSAATATAVFSTTPAVVAVFSRLLLKESFYARKVGSVILAIVGVLCVDLAPTVAGTGADVAAGDVDTAAADTAVAVGLASVAALCAGSYKVVLRLLLGETSAPPVAAYLSCLGGIPSP